MYKNAIEGKKLTPNQAMINFQKSANIIKLSGEWSWYCVDQQTLRTQVAGISGQKLVIDGRGIPYMDTSGAFFLHKVIATLQEANNQIASIELEEADRSLFEMTKGFELSKNNPLNNKLQTGLIERIGQGTLHLWDTMLQLITFFGHLCMSMLTVFKRGHSLYIQGIVDTVTSAGIKGIGISSMLCFLIGVNLTYQMSPQFVTYGANVYIVNFLGIALLREVTPLLTAVIVAGRTGSAITASIGTMKVQEEIDAIQTMGISPMRRLVVPRIIGLLISLPILTMIADVASIFGGMLVSTSSLGVSFSLFLHRMQTYVSINNYAIGIIKTFAFAWIIGMVGCFCGFRVKGNADSIGVQTTRSVVISICLIIFVDALFAIMFKSLGM